MNSPLPNVQAVSSYTTLNFLHCHVLSLYNNLFLHLCQNKRIWWRHAMMMMMMMMKWSSSSLVIMYKISIRNQSAQETLVNILWIDLTSTMHACLKATDFEHGSYKSINLDKKEPMWKWTERRWRSDSKTDPMIHFRQQYPTLQVWNAFQCY